MPEWILGPGLRCLSDKLSACIPPIDLIVCDEGHRLKSKDNKTTKMFESLRTRRRLSELGHVFRESKLTARSPVGHTPAERSERVARDGWPDSHLSATLTVYR